MVGEGDAGTSAQERRNSDASRVEPRREKLKHFRKTATILLQKLSRRNEINAMSFGKTGDEVSSFISLRERHTGLLK